MSHVNRCIVSPPVPRRGAVGCLPVLTAAQERTFTDGGGRGASAPAARNNRRACKRTTEQLRLLRYAPNSFRRRPGRPQSAITPFASAVRTPFTHTPCSPTAGVSRREAPVGRSFTRRFSPRPTVA